MGEQLFMALSLLEVSKHSLKKMKIMMVKSTEFHSLVVSQFQLQQTFVVFTLKTLSKTHFVVLDQCVNLSMVGLLLNPLTFKIVLNVAVAKFVSNETGVELNIVCVK